MSVLLILSAGAKKDDTGRWKNTEISEKDPRWGAPGGDLRTLAVSYLYQDDPSQLIIASGGKGWDIEADEPTRPNLSRIIKDELIELGVPEEKIIEESVSQKTYSQLKESLKIIKAKELDDIKIVSNLYHLLRIQAMIKKSEELQELVGSKNIELVPAEEILIAKDRFRWEGIINQAYQSQRLKEIVESEEKGVLDIEQGKYIYGN